MFSINQINELHDRLGKISTLYQYLQKLNAIGVNKFDSFISDGHSEYYGNEAYKVVSPPVHENLRIATNCNREKFISHLRLHEEGKTDFIEMSKGLAECGIENGHLIRTK